MQCTNRCIALAINTIRLLPKIYTFLTRTSLCAAELDSQYRWTFLKVRLEQSDSPLRNVPDVLSVRPAASSMASSEPSFFLSREPAWSSLCSFRASTVRSLFSARKNNSMVLQKDTSFISALETWHYVYIYTCPLSRAHMRFYTDTTAVYNQNQPVVFATQGWAY